jgi:hypothetical protein
MQKIMFVYHSFYACFNELFLNKYVIYKNNENYF